MRSPDDKARTVWDYISGLDQRRLPLRVLIHLDLEYRLRNGDPVRVKAYLERFSELSADPAAVLDLIAAEHEIRRALVGLSVEEYAVRLPHLWFELLARLGVSADSIGALSAVAVPGTIGRYEWKRSLGNGTSGTVYEARDTALGRTVAVKVLHEDARAD